MHLKHARSKKKMEDFIKEREKTHPVASGHHSHGGLKSMASGKSKPKPGTSRKGSRGG
jgi:hypothetical protein